VSSSLVGRSRWFHCFYRSVFPLAQVHNSVPLSFHTAAPKNKNKKRMKGCTSSTPVTCISSWLFKTQMSFFEQELHLPWWFGMGCLTYSFSGIFMLYYAPKWLGKSQFPWYSFAYFLIFLQGEFIFCTCIVSSLAPSTGHVVYPETIDCYLEYSVQVLLLCIYMLLYLL
jgi:hypothetical protein